MKRGKETNADKAPAREASKVLAYWRLGGLPHYCYLTCLGNPDPCGVTDASPQRVENILHQEDSAQVDWLNFCLDR